MKEKSKKIDNIKWVLTLLIVLYHIQYMDKNDGLSGIFFYLKNLGDSVVPAFALISGFLFWRNVECLNDLVQKMKRRVRTLLIPYCMWNVINCTVINKRIITYDSFIKNVKDITFWKDIALWTYSPHFWYIFMLMFWTILAPVLYLVLKNKKTIIFLIMVQMIYILFKGNEILHSRFVYIIYTWGGIIGKYMPDVFDRLEEKSGIKRKLLIIITTMGYLVMGLVTSYCDVQMGQKVWLYAARAIALIVCTYYLPLLYVGRKSEYRYSFWIFAVHYWLDVAVSKCVVGHFSGLLYQLVTFILVLTIGLALGWSINGMAPRVFRVLTGNRDTL